MHSDIGEIIIIKKTLVALGRHIYLPAHRYLGKAHTQTDHLAYMEEQMCSRGTFQILMSIWSSKYPVEQSN